MTITKKRKVRVYESRNTPGTRDWKKEVRADSAVFHGFGSDYEEFETGACNYAVAICELPDGSVILPRADMVEFHPKPERTAIIVYINGARISEKYWHMIDGGHVIIDGPVSRGIRVGVVAGFSDGTIAQFKTDGLPGVIAKGDEIAFAIPGIELAEEV